MVRKEHWQRSLELYLRYDYRKRKRDPEKLREEMEKGPKKISEEIGSYVREKSAELDDYARRFREDVSNFLSKKV